MAWLSLAVFFKIVSDGQAALIQGMRRIGDLARIGVVGSLLGAIVSVALVAAMGENGVVPALVAIAAIGSSALLVLQPQGRRRTRHAVPGAEMRAEAASLLQLGLAFMASGLLMMGAALLVRVFVLRQLGVEAAGLFHATWSLGGLYVGFVLQAMGADFYPRLVGVDHNKPRANRLVNEQAQVSLLLAGPGVVATLALAPLVLALFYTGSSTLPRACCAGSASAWRCASSPGRSATSSWRRVRRRCSSGPRSPRLRSMLASLGCWSRGSGWQAPASRSSDSTSGMAC